jgi:hypothetical protein
MRNTQAKGALMVSAAVLSATTANAGILETEFNVTIEEGLQYEFDINADGKNDFSVTVGPDREMPAANLIEEPVGFSPSSETAGRARVRALGEQSRVFTFDLDDEDFAVKLALGDSVDENTGDLRTSGKLYDTRFEKSKLPGGKDMFVEFGEFASNGDDEIVNGFVGLAIETFNFRPNLIGENGDIQQDEDGEKAERTINYGWIELTRGSVILVRSGFQQIANAPAPIDGRDIQISEPATLPLMALGAAGLYALRRRKAQ